MSQEQKKTLADVQAGDSVLLRGGKCISKKKVARVTMSYIVVGDDKFSMKTGRILGSWSSTKKIEPWTEEIEQHVAGLRLTRHKKELAEKINNRLMALPLEILQQIEAMIDGGGK